jgi:hypothetical protein
MKPKATLLAFLANHETGEESYAVAYHRAR